MLTIKQINTKIRGIAKRNATLRDDIQTVLVNIAGHALQTRDVSAFTLLFNSVVGQDREAIAKWATEYGLAKLDKNTGAFKLNNAAHKACDCETGDEYVARLMESAPNWYEACATNEQVAKALDAAKRIESVASAIDKAIEEGKAIKFSDGAAELAMKHLHRAVENAQRIVAMQQNNTVTAIAAE